MLKEFSYRGFDVTWPEETEIALREEHGIDMVKEVAKTIDQILLEEKLDAMRKESPFDGDELDIDSE